MIKRTMGKYINNLGKSYPVLTITGPRQSGNTTLCKQLIVRLIIFCKGFDKIFEKNRAKSQKIFLKEILTKHQSRKNIQKAVIT